MKTYADITNDEGFNYPCLVEFKNEHAHYVVLALYDTDDAEGSEYETFAGVCVHDFTADESNTRVGDFATNYTRCKFKPYTGTVKLKN